MTEYVYKLTEPELWTVGFYDPSGRWEPESDHGIQENAAKRTAWLNGSPDESVQKDAERWRKFKSNPFGNDAKFGDELDAMIDSMEATQQ